MNSWELAFRHQHYANFYLENFRKQKSKKITGHAKRFAARNARYMVLIIQILICSSKNSSFSGKKNIDDNNGSDQELGVFFIIG
ncbi:hypothetical protein FQA39_LY02645 [Lamprigera yunnana]|nr:hypothetical protein FQA39_LY02645 [Lamprigera yunnana]